MQEWVAAIAAACARLQGLEHSASDASSAGSGSTVRKNSGALASVSADAGRAEHYEAASAGVELTERLREETARLQRSLDSMKLTLRSDSSGLQDDGDTIPAYWAGDIPRSIDIRRRSRSSTKSLRRAAALLAGDDGPPSEPRPTGRAWRIQVLLLCHGQCRWRPRRPPIHGRLDHYPPVVACYGWGGGP